MKKYGIIILSLFMGACGNTKVEKQSIEVLNIDPFAHQSIRISEIASEIDYIELDPSRKIYFSPSNIIHIENNLLFILETHEIKKFSVYSLRDGKQVFTLNNIGRGPGEMLNPAAFYLDIKKNKIEIYDSMSGKMFYYDFKGNLLGSTKLPGRLFFTTFTKNNNNYLLYTSNIINTIGDLKINKTLLIADSSFNIKKDFFETNPNKQNLFIGGSHNFKKVNEDIYLNCPPDGFLYKVSGDSVVPVIELDFNSKNIPKDLKNNEGGLELYEWIKLMKKEGYFMGVTGYFENNKYKLIEFIDFDEYGKGWVKFDKLKNSYNWFKYKNFSNDIDNGLIGRIVHLDDSYFITFIEGYEMSAHVKELKRMENLPDKGKNLIERFGNDKEECNPILMICKLK